YGIFFGLFVLGGTFSLALFHLKRELGRDDATAPAWTVPFDRRYVTVLAGISLAIFVTSLGIFFGFPRIGLGYFANQGRSQTSVAGFSDNVELGSHGVIRDNPEVVLRVEFPGGRPKTLDTFHWRTMTFDHYDGSGWSRTLESRDTPRQLGKGIYDLNQLHIWKSPESTRRSAPKRLEMYVEPLGSDTLPTMWPVERIEFGRSWDQAPPDSPRAGGIRTDNLGDVHHTVASDIGIPYTIHTRPRPDPAVLREVDKPVETKDPAVKPFLQVPEDIDPIRQLAQRVTSEAETPYAKAEAVEQFLQSNYTYTTNLPKMETDNPVQEFLLEARRGHCEYYASAMALMLRSVDVPTRMVNGFLGGKWNGVGNYLAVRQGDAHSWVEIYLPDYGWIQM
ncbi:MAG: transglutaminaseTgpA domain-containing protein, partial [Bradymonadaceae bacterium]